MISFGCCPYTKSHYRSPVTIVGHGGFSLILSADANAVVDVEFQTNGKYWDIFQIDYKDRIYSQYREVCTNIERFNLELVMENLIRYRNLIKIILSRNNISMYDIKHVLMQNISVAAYGYIREYLKLPVAEFLKENLKHYGHLGEMDVFFNYFTGINNNMINKQDWVLILNNSPAACWGVVLIRQ